MNIKSGKLLPIQHGVEPWPRGEILFVCAHFSLCVYPLLYVCVNFSRSVCERFYPATTGRGHSCPPLRLLSGQLMPTNTWDLWYFFLECVFAVICNSLLDPSSLLPPGFNDRSSMQMKCCLFFVRYDMSSSIYISPLSFARVFFHCFLFTIVLIITITLPSF